MGSAGRRRRSVPRARLPGGAGGVGQRRAQAPAACRASCTARDEGGRLVGAVPLYLKTNSYGEFIFDWSWANAAHRSGIRYYPKLVAAIPFTPATGRRLPVLDAPDVDARGGRRRRCCGACARSPTRSAPRRCTSSSAPSRKSSRWPRPATCPRLSMQFHWHNRPERPFESFEDYLGDLPRRGTASRCARSARWPPATGSRFRTATGAELEPRDWTALRAFYVENVDRHGGHRLSDRRVLRRRAGDAGPPAGGDPRLPRGPSRSPARSTSRRAGTSTAATGAAWPTSRCCTSSSATTGSSSGPSSAATRCSRRAPRASTSSSGASSRRSPTAPTGSATPGSAEAIAGFVGGEAQEVEADRPRVRRALPLPRRRRFGQRELTAADSSAA